VGKKKKTRAVALRGPDPTEVFDNPPGSISVSDPALAAYFGLNWMSGASLTESQVLGVTAIYRCVALISGTIAALPLKVYEGEGAFRAELPDHWLRTSPAGPYDMSPFSWTETTVLHMLLHGESFQKTIHNEGGQVIGLWPTHPFAVNRVRWSDADKVFTVTMGDGRQEDFLSGEVVHIMGPSLDGLRGVSPMALFSDNIATMRAGDTAANRSFTTGALIAGLVTTEEDVDATEAASIKASLNAKIQGAEHAGDIAFVNRSLKFSPWSMTAQDAQYIESRRFSIEEAARIYGIPVSLLSVMGAVSNWGTGISEQALGLQRYVLMGWTSRIESALRAVLPPGTFAEFDYHGLLQGTPREEIELLIAQVSAKLLTTDEARAYLNLPPAPELEPEPEPVRLPVAAGGFPPEEE
jgi:HK97 family phage portal protein